MMHRQRQVYHVSFVANVRTVHLEWMKFYESQNHIETEKNQNNYYSALQMSIFNLTKGG